MTARVIAGDPTVKWSELITKVPSRGEKVDLTEWFQVHYPYAVRCILRNAGDHIVMFWQANDHPQVFICLPSSYNDDSIDYWGTEHKYDHLFEPELMESIL